MWSLVSDPHMKISLMIYFQITDNAIPSLSTLNLCKHISFPPLHVPHSLNTEIETLQSFFCSDQEPAIDRYKPLHLKHCRKLQGSFHTEIQAQHLEGVSLDLGVGSTEITTLLLALLQVSGKEEKQ